MTLVQPESEFFDIAPVSEVESSGKIQLAQGGEQTFTVQPKLGLSAKDDPYVEELVFASDESTEASATVTASVMDKDRNTKNSYCNSETGRPSEVWNTGTGL